MSNEQLTISFVNQLRASAEHLFALLDRFHEAKVLVVGDLTLDEFMMGQVERLSREAPVLILRHEHTQQIPGGGANAVYNLAKLGAQVKIVGILGKDSQGEALRNILENAGIDSKGIVTVESRPTVTKTRIAGHARQSVNQQIVRVDRKSDDLPGLEVQMQLADYIRSQIEGMDAVVYSDYCEGVITPPVIEAGLGHPRVIVDTQKDLHRYQGATLFTPNVPEAEKAIGYSIHDAQSLAQAGRDLLELTQAQRFLITRGEEGMNLFERADNEIHNWHIPAFNRTDVFDVTGAGDTVVSGLTLALCLGATFWEAAVLGNLAASIVVRQFGTATTTTTEMKDALHLLLEEMGSF